MIALAFLAFLALAASYPLVDPDEGRNAEVAREMVASGDLLVPRLAGMPYLDKPPALFWAAGLSIHLLGPIPFAARLPAAIAALLTLIVVARLAAREVDAAFARRVVALLAVAPLFAVIAAYVIFDMMLALCVAVLWTALAREMIHGADPRRRAAMFLALAAGLLVKGPVMLAWAVGGSLGTALLLRSTAPLFWLGWWPGWTIVIVLAGGWFALASARFPEYPRYAFVEESFERMTTGSFRREQPWWFVPAVLAGGALPWSIATPWPWPRRAPAPGNGSDAGEAARRRITLRVALGFVLFAAVFFTLSRSKLVTYLLPAIPPLAWHAAAAWQDAHARRSPAWILTVLYGLLALAFALRPVLDPSALPPDVTRGWMVTAVAFTAAAALALAAALRRRPVLAFAATLLFTPIVLIADGRELVRYAATQSGAPLARAIAATGGGPVWYEGCYSPGTDFLRGGTSVVVSDSGTETTSNYQVRYRRTLMARGQWTLLPAATEPDRASVVVKPASNASAPGTGWRVVFRDQRFAAWRRER